MEPSTTIREMMMRNEIIVPLYQRAYSWDTPSEKKPIKTQSDVFLSDLKEHRKSKAGSPYYFGHFLFEERDRNKFYVIDGQQRLTTIVIFLSALFSKLISIRHLTAYEEECREDIIQRGRTCRFSTVEYDNQLFMDYVINQTKTDHTGIKTESGFRIVKAFDYFKSQLSDKPELYLEQLLTTISDAACTTHTVNNESEAIQMFIFQNNRGKLPSNLEIVKAHFMYNVHLFAESEKNEIINEIKNRFETIYKAISSIEYRIDEDDVLLHTLKIHSNRLWESNPIEKINKELKGDDPVGFVESFTQSLSSTFEYLSSFFIKDEIKSFPIHSLITLGGLSIALPFIIKAYKFGLGINEIEKLCSSFESLILRNRLVGTRADITSRMNDVYEAFKDSNKDIQPIIEQIEKLKTVTGDWWWEHWNNDRLKESLQGKLNHTTAKYLLWKYENFLRSTGKAGYDPIRFDSISLPELEHIAPSTEPEKPHGYDVYDEEFLAKYLNCIGNYLLLSKSHNASIQNYPFAVKHKDYRYLEQQREVQELVPDPHTGNWDRKVIQMRKEKIVKFIIENF
jgi:uncharacterized protein with ParB-like and HNH nuclease domain